MQAFGIEVEVQAAENSGPFPVYEVNWPVLERFLVCSTQWRTGAMGGVVGLDYSACDVAMTRRGFECSPEQFAGMQLMEKTVIKEINDQADS